MIRADDAAEQAPMGDTVTIRYVEQFPSDCATAVQTSP